MPVQIDLYFNRGFFLVEGVQVGLKLYLFPLFLMDSREGRFHSVWNSKSVLANVGLVIDRSDGFFQAAQLEWRIPSAPSRQNGGPGANPCLPGEAERFQVANVGAAIVAKQARSSARPECIPIFFCPCVYMFLGESCGPSVSYFGSF